MKILYFAKFRQVIGRGQDDIDLPTGVATAADLVDYLKRTDEGCALAFADTRSLKVAIDQVHAPLTADLVGATEVAFFPPVTGG